MKTSNGVHITDSLFALVFEALALDYVERYQPAHARPIKGNDNVDESLDATQVLQAVQS